MTTPTTEPTRSLSNRLCKVESDDATYEVNPRQLYPEATGAPAIFRKAGLFAASVDDLEATRCTISSNSSGYTSSLDASFASTFLHGKPPVMTRSSEFDDDSESIASTRMSDLTFAPDTFKPNCAVTASRVPALPLDHESFRSGSFATKDRSDTERFSPSPRRAAGPEWSSTLAGTEPSLPSALGKVTDSATASPPMAPATLLGVKPGVAKIPMMMPQLSRQDSLPSEPTAKLEGSKLHQLETEPDSTRPVQRKRLGQGAEGWFAELHQGKGPVPVVLCSKPPGDPSQVPSNVEELQEALRTERLKVGDLQRRVDEAEAISKWLQGELDRCHTAEASDGANKTDPLTAIQETSAIKFVPEQTERASFRQALATQVEKLQCKKYATDHQIGMLKNVVERQTQEIERLKSTAVTQHLEEEVIQLRTEGVRMRQDLVVARQNEKELRKQLSCLSRRDLDASSDSLHQHKVETGEKVSDSSDMEHLSATMSEQIVAVELELKKVMRERTQLVQPFIRKMHNLLAVALQAADELERKAGRMPGRVALFHRTQCEQDLARSLVSIVEALQYSVDCMERAIQQNTVQADAKSSP